MEIKHKPDIVGFKPGAEDFPLMTVLNVSMDCMASCPNCPYVNKMSIVDKFKDSIFMDRDLFIKIADEVGEHKAWLRLSGREPLLHPHIVDMIQYAKYVGCKVGLNTNGALLTPDVASHLLIWDTDAIIVSVDTGNEDMYRVVRKGLNFNRLVANVTKLVSMRNLYGSKTSIVASIVNQIEAKNEVTESVAFWEKIVDKVMVRKFLTWGYLDESKSGESAPYLGEDSPCPFVFERFNLATDGTAALCGYDIGFEHPVGDVKVQTIAEIWKSKPFEDVRKLMAGGRWNEFRMCADCKDRKYRSWDYNFFKAISDAREHHDTGNRRNNG